jgi:hypothetical protein
MSSAGETLRVGRSVSCFSILEHPKYKRAGQWTSMQPRGHFGQARPQPISRVLRVVAQHRVTNHWITPE